MLQAHRFSFHAMGSPCELHLYARHHKLARQAADRVITDIRRIETCYSRYRSDSITGAINRTGASGGRIDVNEETAALLDYADTCFRESGGLFDITSGILRKAWDFQGQRLPEPESLAALVDKIGWEKVHWRKPHLEFTAVGMELDFGGIGKEYAADRAATICLAQGVCHGLINLGGDIRVIGPHPDGSPWSIGIRHPRRAEALLATVMLTQGGLASSGDYERCIEIDGRRYGHILNPKTGWPAQGLISVSAIAPCCLVAGSACTIAMLKGIEGGAWLEKLRLPHLWMDDEERVGGDLDPQRNDPATD